MSPSPGSRTSARRRRRALGALLGVACLLPPWLAAQPAGAPEAWPAAPPALLLDVPFVAQEPFLCGGAAVEMALRHQGARGIWAKDFDALVRPEEGGIRTDELAGAVRRLGWRVEAGASTVAELEERLRGGRPVIVLLSEGGGRHHYVLVVGRDEGGFVVHDPADRPGVRIPLARFVERWEESGRWAMVVPGPAGDGAASQGSPRGRQDAPRLASVGSPLAMAGERFRAGSWAEAARLAEAAVRAAPDDTLAWSLLATTRYLDGDQPGALRAWNRVGSPRTETVLVVGPTRTRHPVVHDLLGLRPGETLDAAGLERARRRLELLPAGEASSLSWRALPGGRAEVTASVAERPLLPRGRLALANVLIPALARSEAAIVLASPTGGGETLELAGRWAAARPGGRLDLTAPGFLGLPGVGRLRFAWLGERHRVAGGTTPLWEGRAGARLELADWATPSLFWRAGAGLDRWHGAGRTAALEARSELHLERTLLAAEVEAGASLTEDPGYLRWQLEGRSPLPLPGRWSGQVRLLAAGVGADAPRVLRPGAGTGRARDGLLRAHPLERDGALDASLLGTSALNASIEIGRELLGLGPLGTLEAAVFVDALRLASPDLREGRPRGLLDVGTGLRARLPGGTLRLDAALGGGGARALSLAWEARGGRLP